MEASPSPVPAKPETSLRHWVPLEEVSDSDLPLVGGKASKLGELVRQGLPIPPGFVITTRAFDTFIRDNGLLPRIESALQGIDPLRTETAESASEQLRRLFQETPYPPALERELSEACQAFLSQSGASFCAVRSSATAEDLAEASFAGLQDTYLNIRGVPEILQAVKRCWGSLYTPRVIVYRARKGFDNARVKLAVLIQKMVNSDVSGIMFTADPNTGENHVIIEAGWGLGELIVGGEVTPDHYVIDPAGPRFITKRVSRQTVRLRRDEAGGNRREEVPVSLREVPKLSDPQIFRLVSLGSLISSYYRRPMDIEWCLEEGEVYVVQARPITTGGTSKSEEHAGTSGAQAHILTRGLGASPGSAQGTVRLLQGAADMDRLKPGEVLVTTMTMPDMVPAMARASAIVTDEGGMTCHAAIVSRELGVPCVVGTGNATKVLPEGQLVTVEGKLGLVYEGSVGAPRASGTPSPVTPTAPVTAHTGGGGVPVTATRIYVNVSIPEKAAEYAQLPVSGVGLFRIEFLFTSYIRTHPLALVRQGRGRELVEKLAEGIETVCEAFNPRPVIIRTSDFKTNEYRGMPGGAEFEPEESNPMIGWRGCSRYVSPQYREAFLLELEAIERVRSVRGLRNAHLMLPFVRNTEELQHIAQMMESRGLRRSPDFKLYLMAEVPATVLRAEEFSDHCDGFSIGSNDLTQLVMGADRDSEILGKMGYFDERDPAVQAAIRLLIRGAHAKSRTVGICGQAPSVYPEFCEFLVREGIDSISLNADTVVPTLRTVAAAEQRLLLNQARRRPA
jgi:pyruvate,water dikinase